MTTREEELEAALTHIISVCSKSRTRTLRIRWIELMAECALKGSHDWKTVTLPTNVPAEFLRYRLAKKEAKSDEV
jgi:hypothetical protein